MNARRRIAASCGALALALAIPCSEARAQGRPFTLDDLLEIVRSGVIAESRIVALVGQRCIAFTADEQHLGRLGAVGASESVLTAVRGACRILPGEPRWIRVEPVTVNAIAGSPVRLRAIALSPDSAVIDDAFIRWESSDSSVVDVLPDGTLEARSAGIVEVRARGTNDQVSDPATVVVTRPVLARKSTTTAVLLGTIVPGGGQFYTGYGLKGALLFGGSVATAVVGFLVTSDEVSLSNPTPPSCTPTCTYTVTFEKKRPAVIPTLIAAGGLWAYGIVDAALQARATQEALGPEPRLEWFADSTLQPDGTLTVPVLRFVF
jgi:hypothetical protein